MKIVTYKDLGRAVQIIPAPMRNHIVGDDPGDWSRYFYYDTNIRPFGERLILLAGLAAAALYVDMLIGQSSADSDGDEPDEAHVRESGSGALQVVARSLADQLAAVIDDREAAKLFAKRAEFPGAHLPDFQTAIGFWSVIVEQSIGGRVRLERLAEEAVKQFPHNARLLECSEAIKRALRPTRPTKPERGGAAVLTPASMPAWRDRYLDDYLRQMLFLRGYARGLACAILQQAGTMETGPFGGFEDDPRPVGDFLQLCGSQTPSNLLRAELDDPMEERLQRLVEHLRFLEGFQFEANSSIVTFEKRPIATEPFLRWDGSVLHRLSHLQLNDEPVSLVHIGPGDRGESSTVPAEPEVASRLVRLQGLLGLPAEAHCASDRPNADAFPTSILPLFSDSYPRMNQLARKLVEQSELRTRRKLWVEPLLKEAASEEVERKAEDELFVANAIIRRCLNEDPVTLLQEYFREEPEDEAVYLRWLLNHEDEVRASIRAIDEQTANYEFQLNAFYPSDEHESSRNEKTCAYRARLVAQRLVMLMGFPIQEEKVLKSINEHITRMQAFYNYLDRTRDGRRGNRAAIDNAVLRGTSACAMSVKETLRTLVIFYDAIRVYDPTRPDGLSLEHLQALQGKARDVGEFDLPTTLTTFRALRDDPELREALRRWVGVPDVWPGESREPRWEALEQLDEMHAINMNERRGPMRLDLGHVRDVVKKALNFLHWLRNPFHGQPRHPKTWRIYPAVLGLNVATTNSCGIISVRYILEEMRGSSSGHVTLYTRQPLSVERGTFYGLPHRDKTVHDLWVDPILIPARVVPVV